MTFSPHLIEDCYAVEILDPSTGEPVPEGRTGITVVSNLFWEARPILRFEMTDLMEDAVRRELGLDVGCDVVAAGTLRPTEARARRVHDRRRVTASGADRA